MRMPPRILECYGELARKCRDETLSVIHELDSDVRPCKAGG